MGLAIAWERMEDESFKSPNKILYEVPGRPCCFSLLSSFLGLSHIQFTTLTKPVTTATHTNEIKIELADGVSISQTVAQFVSLLSLCYHLTNSKKRWGVTKEMTRLTSQLFLLFLFHYCTYASLSGPTKTMIRFLDPVAVGSTLKLELLWWLLSRFDRWVI